MLHFSFLTSSNLRIVKYSCNIDQKQVISRDYIVTPNNLVQIGYEIASTPIKTVTRRKTIMRELFYLESKQEKENKSRT